MDYTRQAKEVLKIAEKSAKEMAHPYVGTEHLLLGLRKVYTGVAAQVLGTNGVDEENILKVIKNHTITFTPMPKFPAVKRDLALLLDKKISFKEVREIGFRTEKSRLNSVPLYAV